jgi:hypothetical protein
VPLGLSFEKDRYFWHYQLAIGSHFKWTDALTLSVEIGVAAKNTETYLASGLTYFY